VKNVTYKRENDSQTYIPKTLKLNASTQFGWLNVYFPIKTLYYPTDAQIYNSYIELELL